MSTKRPRLVTSKFCGALQIFVMAPLCESSKISFHNYLGYCDTSSSVHNSIEENYMFVFIPSKLLKVT